MNDSRLSGIDPAKLQMLFSMSGQGASKSQNELMPFLMAVAARSRQNGMTFTPEETNLIIEVMKQGKSKEEIAIQVISLSHRIRILLGNRDFWQMRGKDLGFAAAHKAAPPVAAGAAGAGTAALRGAAGLLGRGLRSVR